MGLISAVEAVQVVKAIQRIPVELRSVTFYGANDEWEFMESGSPNMCETCRSYNGDIYFGNELRGLFYDHEIQDENLIYPRVHPNCLCTLVRVYPVESIEES